MNETEILLRPPGFAKAQGQAYHISELKLFNRVLLVGQGRIEFQRAGFQHTQRQSDDRGVGFENFFSPAMLNE